MFNSEHFYWNGSCSKDMNISLITFDNDVLSDYGIDYNNPISKNGSFNGNAQYSHEEFDTPQITLNLCYTDKYNIPIMWDDNKLQEIYKWLITDDFSQFISFDNLDYIYYLKVVSISKKMNSNMTGYLEVVFQPYSNYAYIENSFKFNVDNNVVCNIFNPSNINENYKPIIIIENLGDINTVNSVTNRTISGHDGLIITNINSTEKITIDNLSYIVIDDNNCNKFNHCNRRWLELAPGNNEIEINGNCNISIICDFPIIT